MGLLLSGRAVLVAEDILLIAEDICDAVTCAGGQVVGPAATLKEAMAAAQKHRPHVATLDTTLRGLSTGPLADLLAKMGVPFVVVTGAPEDVVPRRFKNAPHIAKPFYRSNLLHCIATAVSCTGN